MESRLELPDEIHTGFGQFRTDFENRATGRRSVRVHVGLNATNALPHMEPACWSIPVRPALEAALLKAGRMPEADQVFREDLQKWPRNGWSLFGLEKSLRLQGREESADSVVRELTEAWKRADTKLVLAHF